MRRNRVRGQQIQLSNSPRLRELRLGKFPRQLSAKELATIEHLRSQGRYPPPYTYIFTDFLPMLHARGINQADIASILEDNPRRFFAGEVLPKV